MDRILESGAFRAVEALRNLLVFVIDETLAGRGDNLKEYLLATMALGKGTSFDPKVDPIVRVQMRRLRQRLARYYATEGRRDPVVVELLRGTYVPTIATRAAVDADGDESAAPPDAWSSMSAYELDLEARYILGRRSVAAVREAARQVERILLIHPAFAPAYVTLSECYRMRSEERRVGKERTAGRQSRPPKTKET